MCETIGIQLQRVKLLQLLGPSDVRPHDQGPTDFPGRMTYWGSFSDLLITRKPNEQLDHIYNESKAGTDI
jgi:hypothetical protein